MTAPLITPEEAAEKLKIRPQAVRAYLRKGTIRGLQVAGKWRMTEAALDAFIQEQEQVRLSHGAA
jgi:excisionase family DNA binding protein